ncbi:MAG TPA: hypothetical protein VG405_01260 [Solirubrobacteraceae bacterium]|jgi:hypothetical protein|nr:hypothetical protein [Solirubrobacteraceae bacterium]
MISWRANFMKVMAAGQAQRHLRILAAVAGGALVLAGCGSSGSTPSKSSSQRSAGQAIARAAYVSSSASGYRVAINFQEGSSALGGDITGAGGGSFNLPKHAGRVSLSLSLPGSLSSAGTLHVQEILDGQTAYVKLPAQVANQLPGSRPWIKLNLNQMGRAAGIQNLTSLFGGSGSTNPSQFLQYLRTTSSSGVTKVGTGSVDGVLATHYHATINLAKAPAAAPAAERASMRQAVATLQKLTGLHAIPVDVWVDSQHLVRRLTMAYTVRASGQSLRTQIRLDFLSYGSQPVPKAPPAKQVTDAGSLLGKLKK